MFHPLFFHPGLHLYSAPDAIADAMTFVAAYRIEQDLQSTRREETEWQF